MSVHPFAHVHPLWVMTAGLDALQGIQLTYPANLMGKGFGSADRLRGKLGKDGGELRGADGSWGRDVRLDDGRVACTHVCICVCVRTYSN